MKNPFNYKELLKLGFKRRDYTDSIEFDRTGNQPFELVKYLCKGVSISWTYQQGMFIFRKIKQSNYKRMPIESKEQLIQYLDFFERKPRKKEEDFY